MRKLLLLILTAILLAKYGLPADAKTKDCSKDTSCSEESHEKLNSLHTADKSSEITPRIELLAFAVRKFAPLFISVLNSREVVFNVVLESKNSLYEKDLDPHLARLSEYSEKVNTLRKRDMQLRDKIEKEPDFSASAQGQQMLAQFLRNFFRTTSEFSDLIEQYSTTAMDKPEDQQLQQLLQRNGFDKLTKHFAEVFAAFKPKFQAEMDKYLATLLAEDLEKEAKLIKWHEAFKRAPKPQNFVQFVEFFSAQEIFECAKTIKKSVNS